MLEFDRTEHPIRQAVLRQPIKHIGGIVVCPMDRDWGLKSIETP